MTKSDLFEGIVNVCAWMNGSIQFHNAKCMDIIELSQIGRIADKINRKINNGGK